MEMYTQGDYQLTSTFLDRGYDGYSQAFDRLLEK
jgi:hypothetical protein